MAITAARRYETVGPCVQLTLATAGNDTYYKGQLIAADDNGYAADPSDASTAVPMGVYTGHQGQAFEVASGDHDEIAVETGLIWYPFSGAAQSDVGEVFYMSDNGTLTQTAGSKVWGLLCKGFKSGYVLIDFRNPVKMA